MSASNSKWGTKLTPNSHPYSGRDFIALNHHYLDAKLNAIKIVQVSVSSPKYPEIKSHVRGQLYGAMLVLQPDSSHCTKATYIVHADAKGSVPSSIVKLVASSTPLCLANIMGFYTKHGAPIFPLRPPPGHTIQIKGCYHNQDSGEMKVELEFKDSDEKGAVMFKIHPTMYPHGITIGHAGEPVDVKDPEDGKFQVSGKCVGRVVLTFKRRLKGSPLKFELL